MDKATGKHFLKLNKATGAFFNFDRQQGYLNVTVTGLFLKDGEVALKTIR